MTLRARWREAPTSSWARLLATDPNASPSHRPELWTALAATVPSFTSHFLAIEDGDEIVGGMPLIVERRAGLHWLHALPYLLPGAPLASPGAHARVDEAAAIAFAERARELSAVGGEWALFRPDGPPMAEVAERLPGETRVLDTELIDLQAGVEAAWRRVAAHTRQEIKAAERRLAVDEEPAALEEAYALYARQARAWSGHRLRPLELLRRLLEGREPAARLFTARDESGLLAAVLVLVGPAEWMAWWSGVHPEARPRHAFSLLCWSLVERAAAAGCRRLNLGGDAGREDLARFKRRLGAQSYPVPVRWLGPDHAGPIGKAAARLQARLRRGRARGTPA